MGEDRLAGAGLARDRGQPRAEPQLGAVDQQQILDSQLESTRTCLPPKADGAGARS